MRYIFTIVIAGLIQGVCFADTFQKVDVGITDLRIVVPQQCFHGDFDLLLHDYMNKPSAIYLSVKNLETGKESAFPVFKSIFNENNEDISIIREKVANLFTDGEVVKLQTDIFKEKGIYVISVCSNSKEKTCFNQKVQDLSVLMAPYREDDSNYIPDDHIYFRQILESDGSKLLFLSEPLNQANMKEAKKKFNNNSILNEIDILKSLPPQKINSSLVIGMPVFSPKKCGSLNK